MKILLLDIEYREIPGAPNRYVSRDGKVLSTAWGRQNLLQPWPTKEGYLQFKATHNRNMKVHRAVALAWIENPIGASDVNHKDGNKQNNAVENLEWCSRAENIYHALRNGLHSEEETPIVGVHRRTGDVIQFPSQAAASKSGFSQPNINKCLKGLRPHHKQYEWRYA